LNQRINESDTSSPKGNAVYINKLNKIKVLGLIRDHGTISRAEIVEITGLSAPTVSRIVKGLTREEKLLESIGIGDSSGGRPPVMLRFTGELSYVIGVDLGDTLALEVFNEATEYIGIGIASLVNLFNPEMVLIGGGVSLEESLFCD